MQLALIEETPIAHEIKKNQFSILNNKTKEGNEKE